MTFRMASTFSKNPPAQPELLLNSHFNLLRSMVAAKRRGRALTLGLLAPCEPLRNFGPSKGLGMYVQRGDPS